MSETPKQVTHYEVQKQRRESLLEEWRRYRKTVVRRQDVKLVEVNSRRMRRGVYVGPDGNRPSRVMDATLHELAAGVITPVHRHSWDAIMFVESGTGWTEIQGGRIDWTPWDTLHLPSWAWHRHGNDSQDPARFHTWSVEPLFEALGMAVLEEGGDARFADLSPAPRQAQSPDADDPYARRLSRLAARSRRAEGARLITRWDDVVGLVTKRGARSAFLVDPSIGYQTSGLTAVMHELAPGLWQSRHRHGGEAFLFALSGTGYSVVDDDKRLDWQAGDLAVIDHWQWHQHFNASKTESARLIRIHNFDALYDTIRVLLDPLDLFEEPPQLDAPDVTGLAWPDHQQGRPAFRHSPTTSGERR